MRPNIARRDLECRIDRLSEELAANHANLGVHSGRQTVDEAAEPLDTRGVVAECEGERITLTLSSQGSHAVRDVLCNDVLNMPADKTATLVFYCANEH